MDYWLDLHARGKGLTRKPANPASGSLIITGVSGTTIPAGFKFAAPAIGDQPAIEYETEEKYTIGEGGTVEVHVTATEPGTTGNVPAGTIRHYDDAHKRHNSNNQSGENNRRSRAGKQR